MPDLFAAAGRRARPHAEAALAELVARRRRRAACSRATAASGRTTPSAPRRSAAGSAGCRWSTRWPARARELDDVGGGRPPGPRARGALRHGRLEPGAAGLRSAPSAGRWRCSTPPTRTAVARRPGRRLAVRRRLEVGHDDRAARDDGELPRTPAGQDGSRFVAITDPARSWPARPRSSASTPCSPTARTSAAATPRCRCSASCRRRSPACRSTRCLQSALRARDASVARRAGGGNPALQLGAVLGGLARAGRDKLTILASPVARAASASGWSSSSPSRRARRAPAWCRWPTRRRATRRLRRRPRLRARAGRRHARRGDRRARGRRPARRGARRRGAGGPRRADADVGARHRLLRPRARHRPLRPAQRRGREGAGARPARRVRARRAAAAGGARRRRRGARRGRAGRSYVRIQAFVDPERRHRGAPAGRCAGASATACASRPRMGFGPRYLHSTGQLHKGGPPTGRLPAGAGRRAHRPADPGPRRTASARSSTRRRPATHGRCATPAGPSRACASASSRPPSTPPSGGRVSIAPPRSANPLRDDIRLANVPEPVRRRDLRRHRRPRRPQARAGALQPARAAAPAGRPRRCSASAARDVGGDEGLRTHAARGDRGALADPGHRGRAGTPSPQSLGYVQGNFDDPATYDALKQRLDEVADHRRQRPLLPVHAALAVPRDRARSRRRRPRRRAARTRGGASSSRSRSATTCGSAQELGDIVYETFSEEQVFRIDHYLGKETVQNILVLRFANGIFEPVWNRNFIDHVQITVAESIGVEGRGRFYEEAGALRDIVQNHMLQVLSFVAMEPPISFEAEAVRDERGKALAAVQPLRPKRRRARAVRPRLDRRRAGAGLPRGGGRRAALRDGDLRRRAHAHRQLALGRRRRSTCARASGCRSA